MMERKGKKLGTRKQSAIRSDFRTSWRHLDGNGRVEMLLWLKETQGVEFYDGYAMIRTTHRGAAIVARSGEAP